MMQDDNISYSILMEKIHEKKSVLHGWLSSAQPSTARQDESNHQGSAISVSSNQWGGSLSKYIQATSNGTYGAFEVDTESRHKNEENCRSYIQRFLVELDRRFRSSRIQEDFSVLFDPAYLQKNEKHVSRIGYGRDQLNSLSKRYRSLVGFDSLNVINEWESMRPSLASYISMEGRKCPRKEFWKEFIVVQQVICNSFIDDYRNVMLLMNTYLISPTNSAECERGFSASNRIQTNGRSRLMIDTLNTLLTVRLLLPEDIRRYQQDAEKKLIPYFLVVSSSRCHQVIEKTFNLWNDSDGNRRWRRTTLMIDVPINAFSMQLFKPVYLP
jgi:hypothetical protein